MKTTYLYIILAVLVVGVAYLFYVNSKKPYVEKSVFADYLTAQLNDSANNGINSPDTTVVVEEGDEVA